MTAWDKVKTDLRFLLLPFRESHANDKLPANTFITRSETDVKVVNDEENRYWVRNWPSGGRLHSDNVIRVSEEDSIKPTAQKTTTKIKMHLKKSLADGGTLLEYDIIVNLLQSRSVWEINWCDMCCGEQTNKQKKIKGLRLRPF